MTPAQKRLRELRDRQSKERQRMAELAMLDSLDTETRSELDDLEPNTPDLERQLWAAQIATARRSPPNCWTTPKSVVARSTHDWTATTNHRRLRSWRRVRSRSAKRDRTSAFNSSFSASSSASRADRRRPPSANRSRPPSKNAFFQLCTVCSNTPARRPAAAADNSPRNTESTTRSFSSGDFFEVFAMAISSHQTQTENCARNDDTRQCHGSRNLLTCSGFRFECSGRLVGASGPRRGSALGPSFATLGSSKLTARNPGRT